MRHLLTLSLLTAAIPLSGTCGEIRFKKIIIDADHKCEAAAVVDVNRDGKLDVVSGTDWYEAPDGALTGTWKKHHLRDIEYQKEYFDDFGDLILDVNSDGWPDIISGGWFCQSLSWYENPGKGGGEWKQHPIDSPGNVETMRLFDITGDGHLAILPNVHKNKDWPVMWFELTPKGEFVKHFLSDKSGSHGIGFGDVNGDGRADIVTPKGWFEAPVDRRKDDQWKWHEEFDLGHTGIPILVYDVNGDGLADLIWGMGHDYGLFWLEQKRGASGAREWVKHEIDKSFSQLHEMELVDLDGDGHPELITGKRYRAHNDGDPGGKDPCCLYYFTFDKTGTFTRHAIDEGNKVGVGIDTIFTDFNGDGKPDIIAPGKGGLYLFVNEGTK